MSTLKCTYIQQASSASPNITLDASTNATVAGTLAMGSSFKRNRIINGDMRVDQRNAGASVTLSTTTQYPVDRFATYKGTSGATVTAQRSSTAPTGFTNSIIFTASTGATPAAGDINGFWQNIEGLNVADLGWGTASAQTVTLSFWARSSVIGTYSVSLNNGASNRFYVATYSINAANTWEYKTINITGDTSGTWATDNSTCIQIVWDIGYGTNYNGTAGVWGSSIVRRTSASVQLIATTGATFYITGVQLETGSIATPYERQIYSDQLAQCQRYYYRMKAEGLASTFCTGFNDSTTGAAGATFFPVQMRIAPTALEQSGTASDYRVRYTGGANTVCSAVPIISAATGTVNTVSTAFTIGTTSLTAGQGCLMQAATANAYLGWSAEL